MSELLNDETIEQLDMKNNPRKWESQWEGKLRWNDKRDEFE